MTSSEKPLRIDIPVPLTELQIAFSIADLALEGDLPASIFHLQLIANDIADWRAEAQVIAVFHTNAGLDMPPVLIKSTAVYDLPKRLDE
jgi:hypothetical protein